MNEITHERCSELLPGYVRADLAPDQAVAVRAHLQGCPDCSAEHSTLLVLAALPEERLTDQERAGLRRALEVAREQAPTPVPTQRRSLWAWLAPALGATALLAVIALGIATVDFGGGGDDAAETAGGDVQDAAPEAQTLEGAGTGAAQAAGIDPVVDVAAGQLTGRELKQLGKGGFAAFGAATVALEADQKRTNASDDYAVSRSAEFDFAVTRMTEIAGEQGFEEQAQIAECAGTVRDSQAYAILPVYAAFGRYQKTSVLVIGFRWTSEGATLDRYMIWVWERDGTCEVPVVTLSGRIRG